MGSEIGEEIPLNSAPRHSVNPVSLAEARRHAESLKLYKNRDEEEGEDEEKGERRSLLGGPMRNRFSMFSDPQSWEGVSPAVIDYFKFHYLMCLIMFGNALVALPSLVTYMSQGYHTGFWGWSTIGNMGAGTPQPMYIVTIDAVYFAIVLGYISWKFQTQHHRMQDVHLNLPPRAADYTLVVSIPVILTDPSILKPHFEKWGEISAIAIHLDTKNKSTIKNHLDGSERIYIPSSGQAFVTFTYHRDTVKCLNECNRSVWRWLWRYLCSLGLPAEFDINKCRVRVAPDASDLIFENMRYSDLYKASLFIAGALGIFLMLVLNLIVLYYLLTFEYTYLSNRSGLINTILLLLFSRWLALFNYLMKRFSFLYVDLMRMTTRTAQSFLKLAITVASQIFNGGIILLVANFFIYHDTTLFTAPWFIAIAQPTVVLVLANPFVSFFQSIVKPLYFVRSRLKYKGAQTQEELNTYLAPPEFNLTDVYAMLLTSSFITFMFSNGYPLLPIVTCVLFFCKYWLEKYNVLRLCAKPPEASLWPFSFISLETLLLGITFHAGWGFVMYFAIMITSSLSGAFSYDYAMKIGYFALIPMAYIFIFVFFNTPFRYAYLFKMFVRARIFVPKHVYQPYGSVNMIASYILPNSCHSDFKVNESEPVQSNHLGNYWINPTPSIMEQGNISQQSSPAASIPHVSISDDTVKQKT